MHGRFLRFTVREDFALHIPEDLDFAACAPLLCAGITTYSPLKHYNVGPGSRVAILGMGGLGHVGVQIANAMGAEVSVISHGRSKEADARRFGADHFYATSEEGVLKSLRGSFDLILCTVSAEGLDYAGYMAALRPYGVFVDDITQAYDNIVDSRVRYRYVIDTSTFPETA